MKIKSIITLIITIIILVSVTSCSLIETFYVLIMRPPVEETSIEELFQFDDGEIYNYAGRSEKTMVIPSEINGQPVTFIGSFSFNRRTFDSVIIPDSVITINNSAFENSQLKSVTIGNSVTYIGKNAFEKNKLETIVIPNSVTEIDWEAFKNNRLKSVSFGNNLTNIGFYSFADNKIESVIIPDSVEYIDKGAFSNNRLKSVSFGNGVTNIDDHAFQDNQLESIVFPDSVTFIGYNAFYKNKLKSITIGDNVEFGAPFHHKLRLSTRKTPFDDESFADIYNEGGKKAGTYVLNGREWVKQ